MELTIKEQINELISCLTIDQSFSIYDELLGAIYDKVFKDDISIYLDEQFTDDLRCPHCDSEKVSKNRFDQFGRQRYNCNNDEYKCKTFCVCTNTLTYYSKCTKEQWMLFIRCLLNKDSTEKLLQKLALVKEQSLIGVIKPCIFLISFIITRLLIVKLILTILYLLMLL